MAVSQRHSADSDTGDSHVAGLGHARKREQGRKGSCQAVKTAVFGLDDIPSVRFFSFSRFLVAFLPSCLV
ncbi:hypothetical protein CJU90_1617 [Yarrowia sp. C11]|nr:hypothetical protein CJU90_1617 [Yarrowia sp. C11]